MSSNAAFPPWLFIDFGGRAKEGARPKGSVGQSFPRLAIHGFPEGDHSRMGCPARLSRRPPPVAQRQKTLDCRSFATPREPSTTDDGERLSAEWRSYSEAATAELCHVAEGEATVRS